MTMDLPYIDTEQNREREMTETTQVEENQEDLTEGDSTDNDLIKKLRKQLIDAKAQAKAVLSENESFRETRNKQRVAAITKAVNGLSYPQSIVDTLIAKVQDVDEDEFLSLLADLTPVAGEEDAAKTVEPTRLVAPNPSSLGQQVAAAASGGSAVDSVMEALANAKSVDEVNAIALQAGLGDI